MRNLPAYSAMTTFNITLVKYSTDAHIVLTITYQMKLASVLD